MPITDYRQQALDESRSFAERQREQKRQSAFVRQEMPGFAKANPQGFDVHAQGLYAALQSQRGIPAPGAQPAPSNMNAYRIRPDGSKQLQMLEQQSRGFDTAADVVGQQNAGFEAPEPPSTTLNAGKFGGDKSVFVNTAPQQGFGQAIYSDSYSGAQPGAFGGRGNIVDPGGGPFGRTQEQQRKIAERVGQYQSAIDLMRSMRGVPTERERLQRQAGADVSLNQGLGGFLNAAGRRNYARDQLKALDTREASQAESANDRLRLGFDMQQKGIENALEAWKVSQGRYKVQDAKYDPFGNLTQPASVFDTSTAQFLNQPGGFQAPMSIDQATEQATREASERAGYFSSDKSDFGMDRQKWIEQRAQELMGQGGPAGQGQQQASRPQTATDPRTGEKIQWNQDNQKWEPVK